MSENQIEFCWNRREDALSMDARREHIHARELWGIDTSLIHEAVTDDDLAYMMASPQKESEFREFLGGVTPYVYWIKKNRHDGLYVEQRVETWRFPGPDKPNIVAAATCMALNRGLVHPDFLFGWHGAFAVKIRAGLKGSHMGRFRNICAYEWGNKEIIADAARYDSIDKWAEKNAQAHLQAEIRGMIDDCDEAIEKKKGTRHRSDLQRITAEIMGCSDLDEFRAKYPYSHTKARESKFYEVIARYGLDSIPDGRGAKRKYKRKEIYKRASERTPLEFRELDGGTWWRAAQRRGILPHIRYSDGEFMSSSRNQEHPNEFLMKLASNYSKGEFRKLDGRRWYKLASRRGVLSGLVYAKKVRQAQDF